MALQFNLICPHLSEHHETNAHLLFNQELIAPVCIGLQHDSIMKTILIALTLFAGVVTQASAQATQPVPAQPAPNAAARASTVNLRCAPFYLPARSIWQRTVDLVVDADGVRAVLIDGVAVYTFNVSGTEILTAVDGERIQVDIEALTWSSDLRGIVTGRGNCTR